MNKEKIKKPYSILKLISFTNISDMVSYLFSICKVDIHFDSKTKTIIFYINNSLINPMDYNKVSKIINTMFSETFKNVNLIKIY